MTAITCHFCRKTMELDAAIRLGWIPGFVEPGAELESDSPVCPACQSEHIEIDDDGYFVQVTDNV